MSLFDFFKKKPWRHKDPAIRANSVSKIESQKLLHQIVIEDEDKNVKITAIKYIKDDNLLSKIALENDDYDLRITALKSIKNEKLLINLAIEEPGKLAYSNVIKNAIDNESTLKKIAKGKYVSQKRIEALKKIKDQDFLKSFFHEKENIKVLWEVYNVIDNPSKELFKKLQNLTELVIMDRKPGWDSERRFAIQKIKDQNLLLEIMLDPEEEDEQLKRLALENIVEEEHLYQLAIKDGQYRDIGSDYFQCFGVNAIEKINDPKLLKRITYNAELQEVKDAAEWRLRKINY
jgi:hypothetical protein